METRSPVLAPSRLHQIVLGLTVTLALMVGPAGAAASPPEALEIADPQVLAAFFDELIPAQLEQRQIPGASVAVVNHGKLVFARGYGLADVERQQPVVADRTLFHIGSNGKLLTWTAVMQLVEQGRLNLDADVNSYLDFQIPATYPKPITLKHLMTHTAGFENRDFGWLAPNPELTLPLGQWLAANIPARVRPAGMATGYSNYGTALTGYIVERVAGTPFQQYLEEGLLAPLEMQRSTAQQRAPDDLAPDIARGYVLTDGQPREGPSYTYQGFPAGTIRATATDVGHFMMAHLQDGRYGDVAILQPATARRMRESLFRPDPRLNGMAHGFMEMDRNGRRVVGHIGSAAPVQYSVIALLPVEGVGLFVAYNSDTARPLTVNNETLAAFLDHFYPAPSVVTPAPPADFSSRAGQLTGDYQRNNFGGSYTTIEKVRRLLEAGTNRRVSNPGDGTLEITSQLGGSSRFVEVGPDFFQQVDGPERVIFRRDSQGRVVAAYFNGEPAYTFERLSWVEDPTFNLVLVVSCSALFASALIAAVGGWLVGLRRKTGSPGALATITRRSAVGMAALNLLFLPALFLVASDPGLLLGDYSRLRLVLILPLLAAVLAVSSVVGAVLAWKHQAWALPTRLHYTAVALAGLAFVWFLNTWNLLGFHF